MLKLKNNSGIIGAFDAQFIDTCFYEDFKNFILFSVSCKIKRNWRP